MLLLLADYHATVWFVWQNADAKNRIVRTITCLCASLVI